MSDRHDLSCTRCGKRLSRKTARQIDGVVMCSNCMFRPPAQAIEARSGETRQGLDADRHESAVAKPCAQGPWALDQDGYDIAIIRVDQHGRSLIDPVGDDMTQTIAQSGVGQ